MKNWKKAIALLTAITAVASSTSAFAALSISGSFDEAGFSADYTDVESNTNVKVTVNTATADVQVGTQMSFLILNDGTNTAAIDAEDILYIDQKEVEEGANLFEGKISLDRLDAAQIPDGSYPIEVGYYDGDGEFGIADALMVVQNVATTYTVQFWDKAGTQTLQSTNVAEGADIVPPTAPEKLTEGDVKYHFAYWAVKGDTGKTPVTFGTASAAADYIAIYEEDDKYTATFLNDDGSSFGTVQAYEGDKLTLPTGTAETKLAANAGLKMDFVGWIKSGDSAVTDFAEFEMPAEAVTFTANFVERDKHNATFKAHFKIDGDQDIVIPTYEGDPIAYQGATPEKAHHTFLGWSRADDGTVDANLGTMEKLDVTVYAIWEEDAKYSVYFKDDDDQILASFVNQYADTAVTAPATDPTKDGYNFIGWAEEKGADEAGEVVTACTKNVTYYPVWEEVQSGGIQITVLWGDVTGDGEVNVSDASKIVNWKLGASPDCKVYTLNEQVDLEGLTD